MLHLLLKWEVVLLFHSPYTGDEVKCHGNDICKKVQMGKGVAALRNIILVQMFKPRVLVPPSGGQAARSPRLPIFSS